MTTIGDLFTDETTRENRNVLRAGGITSVSELTSDLYVYNYLPTGNYERICIDNNTTDIVGAIHRNKLNKLITTTTDEPVLNTIGTYIDLCYCPELLQELIMGGEEYNDRIDTGESK